MDFEHSPTAKDYIARVGKFIDERIMPNEHLYFEQLAHSSDYRQWRIPPIMEELKAEAKAQGLWNMFLPGSPWGVGLSNLDYAPVAELTGRSPIAPEVFNCSAPDTGNSEVLAKYGSSEQQEQWLKPLLDGKIRSGFAMTEPAVASSDATNMQARAEVRGDEIVINGRKWWTTGAGDPRCAFVIFMGVTDPNAARHQRHSMVLVPMNTKGVRIERLLPVFGHFDEPHGHAEITFEDVRLPLSSFIAGPGRGFEVAQGRLGPGRIHHCMRAIGSAERGMEMICKRGMARVAFGRPIMSLGGNRERLADCRMAIDQARLLTLFAAHEIDVHGVQSALTAISAIKVVAPNMLQMVGDFAIQIHGALGMTDRAINGLLIGARALRIADGPDEVHRGMVARLELAKHAS
jgi:acyl-CoA dehydrogenase